MSERDRMPEPAAAPVAATTSQPSPGALLRALREQRGIQPGVLAATLKVTSRKLELLETDRFEELPDATFVKALALAVCRALKADPADVMAAYAARDLSADPFKDVGKGINEPLRSAVRGQVQPVADLSFRRMSARGWWLVALLAVLASLVVMWMTGAVPGIGQAQSSAPADEATRTAASTLVASVPSGAPGGDVGKPAGVSAAAVTATSPAVTLPGATFTAAAAQPAGTRVGVSSNLPSSALTVSTSADSWLEVVDASSRVVWAQVVPEGESVQLSAVPPLQIVVGNASATRLAFDGQPVDLAAHVRGNVARLQVP
jgi:cytoskeleton protein RodZ